MADLEPLAGIAQEDTQKAGVSLLSVIMDMLGQINVNQSGQLRVSIDGLSSGLTLSSLTTVSTVSTVTNMAQIGFMQASDFMLLQSAAAEAALRRNLMEV